MPLSTAKRRAAIGSPRLPHKALIWPYLPRHRVKSLAAVGKNFFSNYRTDTDDSANGFFRSGILVRGLFCHAPRVNRDRELQITASGTFAYHRNIPECVPA
jgi:hypothetical protein